MSGALIGMSMVDRSHRYFTQYTHSKGLFYFIASAYVITATAIVLLEPWIKVCTPILSERFANPAYDDNPCRKVRTMKLLYLTVEECSFGRRIASSVILGGIVGWERRQADRPAGIRTMALVSLGACLFTLTSMFAFMSGPNTWDASRVSAAIPSGVGFLGAGLIFKQADKDENGDDIHTVHGLTTAASVWLSAAVGIACGGEMYFAATFSVSVMLLLLRFGPRHNDTDDDQSDSRSVPYQNLLEEYTNSSEKIELLKKSDSSMSKRIKSQPHLV